VFRGALGGVGRSVVNHVISNLKTISFIVYLLILSIIV
jgi:hypothetical protein